MELISKKTTYEFREYLVNVSLRDITRYFDNHDVACVELPPDKIPTGARRGLVTKYYEGTDWNDPKSVGKILLVFSDILHDANENQLTWGPRGDKTWFQVLNSYLKRDGYQFENGKISKSGHIAHLEDFKTAVSVLDKGWFQDSIERIRKSVDQDPGLAIGSTKELLESILKTILAESDIPVNKDDDIPKLLKQVQKVLDILPEGVDEAKKGAETIKILLSNLGQVVIKISELRNLYGTGHGKAGRSKGLNERHARLTVGAGITLSTFLLDTFELKKSIK